ncbi:MAG: hypothetical protein HYR63_10305, partial [Proteobacteria bacterium]|nr:hypothetical protein [Pseudomonadota bacterium]
RMIAVASQMAPAHAKMALALEELHRPTEAATARRRALVLEPRDPASYVRLGRHLVTAKDDDGARTQHRRAAALDAYALAYVVNNLYAASRGRLWLTYDHLRQDLAGR